MVHHHPFIEQRGIEIPHSMSETTPIILGSIREKAAPNFTSPRDHEQGYQNSFVNPQERHQNPSSRESSQQITHIKFWSTLGGSKLVHQFTVSAKL